MLVAALLLASLSSFPAVASDLLRPSGWIADPSKRLPPAAISSFRREAERVKRETGGEIAAVVLDSLAGRAPRAVAQELFDAWHLGGEEKRGLLIVVVLDERRVEMMLGRGIDDERRRRACDEILHQALVPRLRTGDVGGALAAGADESASRIFDAVTVVAAPEAATSVPLPPPVHGPRIVHHEPGWTEWIPIALILAVILVGVALWGGWRRSAD